MSDKAAYILAGSYSSLNSTGCILIKIIADDGGVGSAVNEFVHAVPQVNHPLSVYTVRVHAAAASVVYIYVTSRVS